MKRFLLGAAVAVLACSASFAGSPTKEQVTSSVSGNMTTWRIVRPVITQPEKNYTKIKFEQGDTVTIEAGGCDQTGGLGKTWKRYVDPQGPNADRLYHGLIEIPGVTNKFKASPTGKKGLVRFLDMGMKQTFPGPVQGQLRRGRPFQSGGERPLPAAGFRGRRIRRQRLFGPGRRHGRPVQEPRRLLMSLSSSPTERSARSRLGRQPPRRMPRRRRLPSKRTQTLHRSKKLG